MDLFHFCSWALVVLITVAVAWPLNIPLLYLACKVRRGGQPLDYEPGDFWWRCVCGTLGLALFGLVCVGIAYAVNVGGELDRANWGIIHLVLLLLFIPGGVAFLWWILALEDLLEGLQVFLLYVLIPAAPVLLVGWLTGLWRTLGQHAPWLLI